MRVSKQSRDRVVKYWMETAQHDYETMLVLFENKRYSDSLFFGHIALEKILKALYVQIKKEQAPYTHDLVSLARDSETLSSNEMQKDLEAINDFNIRGRYPGEKLEFYKKADKMYTDIYITKIKLLYKNFCQKITQS